MRLVSVLLAGFLVFAALPAGAQNENRLYQISDVAVDLTLDAATFARDAALAEAQSKAFDQLMARLASGKTVEKPDAAHVAAMVSSFEIQKEHITGKRYIGTFSILFDPVKTRRFLDEKSIVYHETQPVQMLVLPVTRQGNHSLLWEDITPWRSAWAQPAGTGIVNVVLPEGDLQDIAIASTEEIERAISDKLVRLVRKYNTDGALVVTYPLEDPKGGVSAMMFRVDKAGQTGEAVWIPAHDEKTKEALPLPAVVQGVLKAAEEQQIKLAAPHPELEGHGVPTGAVPLDGELMLPAVVPVDSLAQWSVVQRRLAQVDGIVRVTVQSMTRGLVRVEIASSKPFDALQEAMSGKGLYMALVGDGNWEIRTIQ